MGAELPELPRTTFERRLAACAPEPLPADTLERLWAHYQELRRWNRRLSLIGPGSADELVERHYGEALAALPLLPVAARRLVDVGSGAGFPGLVLAAARPGLEATLVEARERKWAFLLAACRRAQLSVRCLNARVAASLPEGFPDRVDVVTARALKLAPRQLDLLAGRLAEGSRMLLWLGRNDPDLPPTLRLAATHPLQGHRRIVQLYRP